MLDVQVTPLDVSKPVWVVAHLYSSDGTFLIGLTTREEAKRCGYYAHAQYDTLEAAEGFVRIRLERIEKQRIDAYVRGERRAPHQTRQADSPFLRHVFRNALKNIGYNGWVEVA